MSHQNYNMEEIDALLDLPSPSNSQYYMYGDAEQYVDNSTSESQSPVNSPVGPSPHVLMSAVALQPFNTKLRLAVRHVFRARYEHLQHLPEPSELQW